MFWLRTAKAVKVTVALATVLGWLVGTNHCLLPVEKQGRTVATSHCPAHSHESGAGPERSSGMLSCCQGLLSTHSQLEQSKISCPIYLAVIQFLAIDHPALLDPWKANLRMAEYDTGPPTFFIRTVLRHSLQENAPPAFSLIS
jgi:hypothetical protein